MTASSSAPSGPHMPGKLYKGDHLWEYHFKSVTSLEPSSDLTTWVYYSWSLKHAKVFKYAIRVDFLFTTNEGFSYGSFVPKCTQTLFTMLFISLNPHRHIPVIASFWSANSDPFMVLSSQYQTLQLPVTQAADHETAIQIVDTLSRM